jgi:hypothetical protein
LASSLSKSYSKFQNFIFMTDRRLLHSAASLAPRFRFLPLSLASTGARNFPV